MNQTFNFMENVLKFLSDKCETHLSENAPKDLIIKASDINWGELKRELNKMSISLQAGLFNNGETSVDGIKFFIFGCNVIVVGE